MTVFPVSRDIEGLAACARRARRDGFTGMMAVRPAQVAIIDQAFTSDEAEPVRARAIVAAFAARPDVGALQIDGRMIDAPHLKQARQRREAAGELR